MANLVVELLWDEEELGRGWMNIDNLRACLYGNTYITEQLCQVRLIEPEKEQGVSEMTEERSKSQKHIDNHQVLSETEMAKQNDWPK